MASQSLRTRLLINLRRIFKKPFQPYTLENKYRIVPAFEYAGKRYYMFSAQEEVPSGRQMAALAIYTEMEMRVDREFLIAHTNAMEKVLSDPKKINIGIIAQLNYNLKDRLNLMVLPDFVYKLASVVFFDETESPYKYDFEYNEKKIAKWKEDGATLDFFLQTPLKDLIPSLQSQEGVSETYLAVAEQVSKIHQDFITGVLSESR